MASRELTALDPKFRPKAEAFLRRCEAENFPVLIYCTYRSPQEQAILYRQSRTLAEILAKADELRREFGRDDLADILMGAGPQSGPHVTNAGPGQSLHGYRLAFDGVPMVHGKPLWARNSPETVSCWARYGELGEACGLEWSGRWRSFPEFPHFQDPAADWRELIRNK